MPTFSIYLKRRRLDGGVFMTWFDVVEAVIFGIIAGMVSKLVMVILMYMFEQ